MRHTIKGCLVKYDTPWHNGTVIKPGAFDSSRVQKIPISKHFPYYTGIPIGHADLTYEEDGIYYTAYIDDTCEGNEAVKECKDKKLALGLYATHVKSGESEKEVVSARLSGASFTIISDGAAMTFEIDGEKVDQEKHE